MTHTPKNRETLVNPITGDRATFLETADTGGAYLRVHHVVQPGAAAPYHWHPRLYDDE